MQALGTNKRCQPCACILAQTQRTLHANTKMHADGGRLQAWMRKLLSHDSFMKYSAAVNIKALPDWFEP